MRPHSLVEPSQAEVVSYIVARCGQDQNQLREHLAKLHEEVGELSDACYGYDGHTNWSPPEGWEQNLRDEIADVATVCMAMAECAGFDLQEAIAAKWARRKPLR